jgi:hypothetical protein
MLPPKKFKRGALYHIVSIIGGEALILYVKRYKASAGAFLYRRTQDGSPIFELVAFDQSTSVASLIWIAWRSDLVTPTWSTIDKFEMIGIKDLPLYLHLEKTSSFDRLLKGVKHAADYEQSG